MFGGILAEQWVRDRDTVTDWGEILAGANLPRGIRPSDIDGVLEVNGHFLFMEKKGPLESEAMGQRLMLEALARNPKSIKVIRVVRGSDGVEAIYDYRTGEYTEIDPADFIRRVEEWAWNRS